MITIQNATLTDATDLANIMIDGWTSAFCGILPNDIIHKYTQLNACIDMFHHILSSNEGTMYLAKFNGKSVGLLYLVNKDNHANIEGFFTHSIHRSCGIGTALMQKALADTYSLGITTVSVWPFAQNTRGRHFYEKWGFAPTGNSRINDVLEIEYARTLL